MNRRKKLIYNTISALVLQVITLICGLILPRQILQYFGSDVNGLVTSISQFLSVIVVLELGVGPVIQSNLYKPLAGQDKETVSKIVVSAERFYRKIAYIFIVYISFLLVVYPRINKEYDFCFTASLILIISISSFAQYFFGITYQNLLSADQKIYIHSVLRIFTVILNTVLSIILMRGGCSIHVVKLISACVFVVQPIVLNLYVKKKYNINRKIIYNEEPIKQKWNGLAQHLAAVVCSEIDVVLLTFLASYQDVSIYSVYLLVVNGITNLVMTTVSGLESFWGNMMAKNEEKLLIRSFEVVECLMHMVVTVLFCSTAILITPFVSVYVKGIEDSSAYILPLFGGLLTFAYGVQCLRVPYFRIIKAAGHYKQTQSGAIGSMLLNIVISLLLVKPFGLNGVALGTLAAMLYHTIYFAWYLRKNILVRPIKHFIKYLSIDSICVMTFFVIMNGRELITDTYYDWIVLSIQVFVKIAVISIVVNILLNRKFFINIRNLIFKTKEL